MSKTDMTLREVNKTARKLRFDHPGKEIVVVFKKGMPRIEVKD